MAERPVALPPSSRKGSDAMAVPQNVILARYDLRTLRCLVDRAKAELAETKVAGDRAIATSLKVIAEADEVLAGRL